MNPSTLLTPGQTLGKYQILSELGRGGMGCVYLALDQRLNRRVAVKAIRHHDAPDDGFVEKLAHEARIIANLSHPNVVHVHAFDVIDGIPVIEMEFIQGGSLAQRFRDEFVLPAEAVRHAHGVSRALAYSHSVGAIHRDVKPSNILIDQHDHARLADFGIAKVLAESEMIALTNSRSSVFRGTPYYAPPEAWDGEEPSESWDLYSLGAVLYEAVSGAPPHVANTPLELAMKMATERVQPIREVNPKISPDLGALIDDLLKRDPDARPEGADDVCDRLEHLPEFSSDTDPKQTITITGLPKRGRVRKKRRPTRRTLHRIALAACLMGAFTLTILVWEAATQRIWSTTLNRSVSAPLTDGRAPQQNLAILGPNDGLADLMHTRRSVAAQTAFDIRLTTIDEEMRWLVEFDDSPRPLRALGFNDGRLVSLAFAYSVSGAAMSGDWAGYGDASGTVFRSGRVAGEVEWDDKSKVMLGTLTFANDSDGAVMDTNFMATPADGRVTDVQFAYWLEDSETLTPMMFRELSLRDLSWADQFDGLLPVYKNGTAVAHHLTVSDASASAGALDHLAWRRILDKREPLPDDVLVGIPLNAAPIMRTSVSNDRFSVGMQTAVASSMLPVHMELQIVKEFLVPISASPTFRLIYYPEDGSAFEHYGTEASTPLPGSSTVEWEFADGVATIAVDVPFNVFGLDPTAPATGARMRVGAAIISDHEDHKGQIVAHWGFPADGVAKHGSLVRVSD